MLKVKKMFEWGGRCENVKSEMHQLVSRDQVFLSPKDLLAPGICFNKK